ncbi:MAG: MFS transporter, partial [Pseudomonadales bacterium]
EAIPALAFTVFCFMIPESPRWLIGNREDKSDAIEVLQRLNPTCQTDEIDALVAEISDVAHRKTSTGGFWSGRLKVPILLAFLIAFFNQLSGINAVLYFAPRIFELTGLGEQAALLQSVGIGVTNLVFTFAGLWL